MVKLYYYDGSDSDLTKVRQVNKEVALCPILPAGNGWRANEVAFKEFLKTDTAVFTNDINLLNNVPYNYLEHTFPIAFVDTNDYSLHILKDIYPNTREVNDLRKMYLMGIFRWDY